MTDESAMEIGDLRRRLSSIPVGVMSDVLAAMGLPDQVLSSVLRPIGAAARLAGPALCLTGQEGPERPAPQGGPKAVYEMDRRITNGCIAVIGTGGYRVSAVIGGNVGISWHRRGCGGIVTDGLIRDVAQFVAIGMPVFAGCITPLASKGRWSFSGIDVPVILPGQTSKSVTVRPGDIVHGDHDGVVIIPREHAGQAVRDAEVFESIEKKIQAELEAGSDREEVYKRNDRLGHIRKAAGISSPKLP